jgi:transcriptional regulator with GAF, ATPase, and Fis domain
MDGQIVRYSNKYTINSINSTDSIQARNINFQQNVDWPGETHNVRALEATDWQIEGQDGAATALGVPPSTLRKRMQKYGIHRPQEP